MNDVQDYLGGYGEDYGQMTDEMILSNGIEPDMKDKKNKKSSKKKPKKEKEKKAKKSSKTKINQEKETPPKAKQVTISTQEEVIPPAPKEDTDDEPLMEEGMIREEGEGVPADDQHMSPLQGARSQDSIDAHPSFESLVDDDEEEIDREREASEREERVTPPEETEHYTEAVRRLQEANEEYEEQHFGKVTYHLLLIIILYTLLL